MRSLRWLTVLAALVVTVSLVAEQDAQARAGGGRSSGSRGSRSYSRPMAPPSQSPSRSYTPSQPYSPYQQPYQQPYRQPSGGFFRSMLGGVAGGLLGGMLFRSLGFGGGGAFGGGGIGLFDILLLVGVGYLIYRFVTRRRGGGGGGGDNYYQRDNVVPIGGYQPPPSAPSYEPERDEVGEGIAYIRRMDPSFDEQRFGDQVMDIFFKIQGAWMNRDLSGVSHLLTDDMRGIMQRDLDRMRAERRVNRLENIAVRSVEISEAWQEAGQDFVTALIYANLLDYTTDDRTGEVVEGSKVDPVKFEEYWTFTRPVGANPWRLSAITQK